MRHLSSKNTVRPSGLFVTHTNCTILEISINKCENPIPVTQNSNIEINKYAKGPNDRLSHYGPMIITQLRIHFSHAITVEIEPFYEIGTPDLPFCGSLIFDDDDSDSTVKRKSCHYHSMLLSHWRQLIIIYALHLKRSSHCSVHHIPQIIHIAILCMVLAGTLSSFTRLYAQFPKSYLSFSKFFIFTWIGDRDIKNSFRSKSSWRNLEREYWSKQTFSLSSVIATPIHFNSKFLIHNKSLTKETN